MASGVRSTKPAICGYSFVLEPPNRRPISLLHKKTKWLEDEDWSVLQMKQVLPPIPPARAKLSWRAHSTRGVPKGVGRASFSGKIRCCHRCVDDTSPLPVHTWPGQGF